MAVEIKSYTLEQTNRITQFHRAFGMVASLREREADLRKGINLSVFDGYGETKVVGFTEYRIFVGALNGMFDECMDLELKEDLTI